MKTIRTIVRLVFCGLAAIAASAASASVVVSATRVVYPAEARDVTIRLSNTGQQPGLIQAWVDDGDLKKKPEELDVPFSVTPTMTRMDPGRNQVMRLVYRGAKLPQDRESLFWLNVLEIPPKPDAKSGENYLQFALRSRLKIFFRPPQLKGAEMAASQLQWTVVASESDGEWALKVVNPTPFHVSFAEMKVDAPAGAEAPAMNGMVIPFGEMTVRFKPTKGSLAGAKRVMFKWVDDYGAFIDGEALPR